MWKGELPWEQVFPHHENTFKMKTWHLTNAFVLEFTSFKEYIENMLQYNRHQKKSWTVFVSFKIQTTDLVYANYFF